MIRHGVHRLLSGLTAVALVAAGATACSAPGETVVLLSSWSGAERDAFENHVLAEFTRQTGIEVEFRQATRALDQELQKDLETGTQPNIAILPSGGQLETFAAQDALQPLDETLGGAGRFGPLWQSVEEGIQPPGSPAHRYALPVVVSLKSAIWYSPAAMRRLLGQDWQPPTTWAGLDDLTAAIAAKGATPWCMGFESTPVSGWPGTDWVEDLLLHQASTTAYEKWANGDLSWRDSPDLARALSTWGDLVSRDGAIAGGTESALLTNFAAAGKPLFTPGKPGCYLHHTAYIDNSGGSLRPGTDYDFFPFPAADGKQPTTYEVAGDFAAVFKRSDAVDKLMRFLASDAGQAIWPAIPHAAAFSPDPAVRPDSYPDDPVRRKVARILTEPNTLCFDASDLMPPGLSGAFNQAMLGYLSDPHRYRDDPAGLTALLANLDKVRAAVYPDGPRKFRCGQS
jgi:alpha-glucoside transport system substrate-binding protein